MSIANEINRVIRRLKTTSDSHQVVLERAFDTDAVDLWAACTNPQRVSRWLEPVSGDLTLGGRYTLTQSGTEGDIVRCEPPRHLSVTWEYEGDVSRVDVNLIQIGTARTLLRVIHHVPFGEHWEAYGPGATGVGWEAWLRALSLHLDIGPCRDPHESEAVASTHAGHELTHRIARAWSSVDEEAGTPAAEAKARGARTAAFYCGTP